MNTQSDATARPTATPAEMFIDTDLEKLERLDYVSIQRQPHDEFEGIETVTVSAMLAGFPCVLYYGDQLALLHTPNGDATWGRFASALAALGFAKTYLAGEVDGGKFLTLVRGAES